MREIEFMAWDKNKEYGMCRVIAIDWINSEACLCINKDTASQVNLKFDRLEILEYTGLKIKDGKKIFEGNIIRYNYFYNSYNSASDLISVVQFEAGCFVVYRHKGEEEKFNLNSCDDIEILGDIYTTPELIKKPIKEII